MTDGKYTTLTPEDVRFRIDYNPETGEFLWKNSKMPKKNGKKAGNPQKIGYYVLSIDKIHYLAHRIAWCHFYGEWPELLIDHIDGDKLNNKISNLRLATKQENQWNSNIWKSNKSGFKGVFWNSQKNKWQAKATKNYAGVHLGFFDDPLEASEAYKKYAEENHGMFYNPDSLRNRHEHDCPKIIATNG